jgi:addiction module HigA family antidote
MVNKLTMATRNEYNPQTVTHPGVTLEEKIQEMELSVEEFAMRIHEPKELVTSIIKGESTITFKIATALENETKIPARFWLARQARYDEVMSKQSSKHNIDSIAWPSPIAQNNVVYS